MKEMKVKMIDLISDDCEESWGKQTVKWFIKEINYNLSKTSKKTHYLLYFFSSFSIIR